MGNVHFDVYNAFRQSGVSDEEAQKAAIAVAGEQSAIMEKLTKMESDIREDIHSLDKKFLIITTVMSTALPIIGGMLVFVLRAIN